MNPHLRMTIKMLVLHGNDVVYKNISEGAYNVETGSATESETSTTVKAYKKHIVANQYRYPNLVDKDLAEFYIAGNALLLAPRPKDKIVFNSDTYVVESVIEHRARGEVVLYCIVASKS